LEFEYVRACGFKRWGVAALPSISMAQHKRRAACRIAGPTSWQSAARSVKIRGLQQLFRTLSFAKRLSAKRRAALCQKKTLCQTKPWQKKKPGMAGL
jgi:hypothetical protein